MDRQVEQQVLGLELEPGVAENKYYAPGVGQIKAITIQGGSEESHLVTIVTNN